MTKTFPTVNPHRLIDSSLSLMMRLRKNLEGFKFGILNFDHWDLFDISILVLGILWMFIKPVIIIKPVNPHN